MRTRRPTTPALLLLLGGLALAGCQSQSQSGPSSPMPPMPPSAPSPSSPSPSSPSPSSPSPSSQPRASQPPSGQQSGQQSPQQSGSQQPAGSRQPPGSQQPAGSQQPSGSQPGSQQPGGETSPATASTDGADGGETGRDPAAGGDPGGTAGVDDDGVLAQAVEVFRRSAARSRSAEAPADGGEPTSGSGAPGGMGDPADAQADGAGEGGMPGDLDDLVTGDLDDLIAGGGQTGRSREPAGDIPGDMDGSATGDGAESGPWHQPGAAGRGQDPTSEEVYGDASGTGEPGSGEQAGSGGQTAAERHAELERVLAEAMGDFDGRILDERQTILARRGNAPGTIEGPGRRDDGGEGEAAQRGGRDAAGRRPVPPPPAPTPEQQPDGQSGTGSARGSVGGGEVLPIPDDVGDGADDDVVARQLREAAMAETDPELREKLWDEYRRYVAGRR